MGEKIELSGNPSYGETLTELGYKTLSFTYREKHWVSYPRVQQEFEPVIETQIVQKEKDGNFFLRYMYWKHRELDFYIKIGEVEDYMDEEDEEHTVEASEYSRLYEVKYNLEDPMRLIEVLNDFVQDRVPTSDTINIIVQTQHGFELKNHKIKPPELDIDTMYNEDFRPVYEHVVYQLARGDKGIVLFHGEPGTLKTTLIRHLTQVVPQKFIFIPINLIGHVSSPEFIDVLLNNKGSILVIEDCENYIQDRNINDSSIVSPLLQISDGILSDLLEVKILCTYNNSAKIDPALKRPGRLIAEYEFKALTSDRVENLTDGKYTEPMTAAQIFSTNTYKSNKQQPRKIGF